MTYHRLFRPPNNEVFVRTYFKGSSVRKFDWVKHVDEATILPTEDAHNVKTYFKTVAGYDLVLEPVLPEELKNAIKT